MDETQIYHTLARRTMQEARLAEHMTSPALDRNTDPELQEQLSVAELQQRFHEHAD